MINNSKSSTIQSIQVDKLKLDINNPRFAELYSGSEKEEELIDYLLYNESAEEVAKGIINAGEFYPDRPLWVLKEGDSYLIKDGNRRGAAVKALNNPSKYELKLPKQEIIELPVLVYESKKDLDSRIMQEHTNSLFREWDRIAKALEAYKLYASGSSIESIKNLDSQPSSLIKLASFYYAAVKIGGDEFKMLLRRGRKSGGKTIIFERLFKYSKLCGYSFRNKPSYQITVKNKKLFSNYIKALIQYLKKYPKTKTQDIDNNGKGFLKNLEPFGFSLETNSKKENKENEANEENTEDAGTREHTENNENDNKQITSHNTNPKEDNKIETESEEKKTSPPKPRKSIKTRPSYQRKKIPANIESLIKECYDIDAELYPNAKMALARVTFENTLKFIVENTKYNNKSYLFNSNYFRNVFFDKNNNRRTFTDFSKLKTLFVELIQQTGIRKAFDTFDIEITHQIIHNYHVGALRADSITACSNLIPLIEFMLQEESTLLNSLDKSKL